MTLKASIRGAISPFIVMDVMRAANERAAKGDDVLHLEVGQPSTAAPSRVLDAAREALETDRLGYTDALGLEPLRRRIALFYKETYGVEVDWRRVAVTTGSSGAFVLAFLAVFDAGDRVALASPGYPAYRNILSALGIQVIDLMVGPDTNFQPSPSLLDRIDGRLDGLIVASPANPTGTMLHEQELADLTTYCRERRVRLISDEIYHGITYERAASTVLSLTQDAIVINSFSKYFSMTGWRIGWMVLPEPVLRSVECLAQNFFISPPTLSQRAAIAAFDCIDELNGNVARYARNRDILLRELPQAGFADLAAAEGAFYIYANVASMTENSRAFCGQMLAETGVAVTPGVDFDPFRGNRFIRFSFAGSTEDMSEAVRRLSAW
ncbi:MAG: aminotransferase class I/II-fold pyridoxal phosphate-dependent enzyme [Rhodospirillales bacterium]|nr:aminotransferase class I/II-fold pyridoxal phosphate-dependent enzyme [Rhodospirillales bacterium]